MFLKNLLNKSKDAAVQFFAAWFVNHYHLNRLGHMTSLRLDSEKQEIFMSLDLRGEQTPVELTVSYRLLDSNQIEIVAVRSSREWIATLVNEMIPGEKKRVTVPAMAIAALSKMIR